MRLNLESLCHKLGHHSPASHHEYPCSISGIMYVVFAVDKVVMGQVFLRNLQFPLAVLLHQRFIIISYSSNMQYLKFTDCLTTYLNKINLQWTKRQTLSVWLFLSCKALAYIIMFSYDVSTGEFIYVACV